MSWPSLKVDLSARVKYAHEALQDTFRGLVSEFQRRCNPAQKGQLIDGGDYSVKREDEDGVAE